MTWTVRTSSRAAAARRWATASVRPTLSNWIRRDVCRVSNPVRGGGGGSGGGGGGAAVDPRVNLWLTCLADACLLNVNAEGAARTVTHTNTLSLSLPPFLSSTVGRRLPTERAVLHEGGQQQLPGRRLSVRRGILAVPQAHVSGT